MNNLKSKFDKDVPVWDELMDKNEVIFIIGAGNPKRFWNCIKSEQNVSTLKEIFKIHNVKVTDNLTFQDLKNMFKETFRKINLCNEMEWALKQDDINIKGKI